MKLPADFVRRVCRLMGEEEGRCLCEALLEETPVSVRVNTSKCAFVPEGGQKVPWCREGYYLPERPTFTFDPLFHAGCYYVQEASSMFLEQALRQYVEAPVAMLDLCAAPGGKSTLARSVLPEGSLLVSNEVMRNRSQILAENLTKWGDAAVVVTNSDPSDFGRLGPVFDVMLTDVPCSGEGMFRKDKVAIDEWSEDNVALCWQRQRRILRDSWPCLKPGGILIYSTCTFNREENEDNVAWIARELGAEVLPLQTEEAWRITGNLTGEDFPVYRFLPHRTKGEGLFLAVLRKQGESGEAVSFPAGDNARKRGGKKVKEGKSVPAVAVPKELQAGLSAGEDFVFTVEGVLAKAFPARWQGMFQYLKEEVRMLHAGVVLGELKGRGWIPHPSLALSASLSAGAFPQVELTYGQAVAYLRKEAVMLDAAVPKGYVLVAYRGCPLGFVKNIGNRANNLYPNEWRIRSGYLPEELKMVF